MSSVSVRQLPLSTRIFAVSAVALMVLLAVLAFVPLPYSVRVPGPTLDTLGSSAEGRSLITVEGAPVYPTGEGELRLTTVSVSGGPETGVMLFDVIRGWLRTDAQVVPRSVQFPPGQDSEQLSEYQKRQMAASQEHATAAALQELGFELDMTLRVAELMEEYPAADYLQVDDVLRAITVDGTRHDLLTFAQLTDLLQQSAPGTELQIEVERDGEITSVTFPTSERPEGDTTPGSLLGVWVFTELDDLPVDVSFDIDRIGGPSAGMMFALGIVDLMTPGELTGGMTVAGTGTVSIDGNIGPIGGIAQKMHGAVRDGATWFLAPASNCAEVLGNEPRGLQVAAVETLDEAVTALEAIADGEMDNVPTCASVN